LFFFGGSGLFCNAGRGRREVAAAAAAEGSQVFLRELDLLVKAIGECRCADNVFGYSQSVGFDCFGCVDS
jgi:hypothetical protein